MHAIADKIFRTSIVAMSFALVVPAAPALAEPTSYAATIADAQVALDEALKSTGATSMTAALTDLDGTIWQGVVGAVDASGTPATANTRYGIGSTSKMFATTAVMQLVDAGKVGLDQPVVRYLPEFTMRSPQYRQITVRMLLDHSAGLPGSSYASGLTTAPYDGYAAGVLKTLSRSTLKTTPGAMSVYCNDCFTLSGEVVARVSGMPFTTYVQRNILAPLGMTNSGYLTRTMPASGTVARVVRDGRNTPLEVPNFYATGGLLSTASDMAAFGRMLLRGGTVDGARVLSASSVATMGRSQLPTTLAPAERNPVNYGLGWDTVSDLSLLAVGVRAWAKGGDTMDYHASLVVAPEAGLAAFVGGAGAFSSGTAQAVADRMILNALVERGDLSAVPTPLGTDQPPAATPSVDDLNAMLGTYLNSFSGARRVTQTAGAALSVATLVDGEWKNSPVTFSFRSDGRWWADQPAAASISAVTGWGRTYLVQSIPVGFGNAFGDYVVGQRVTSNGATAAAWRDRLGEWLLISERPDSVAWLGSPILPITTIPGLPGYLLSGEVPFDARHPNRGSMFLQVPLMWGRDLTDVVPDGDLLVQGDNVMRKRTTVPALAPGVNSVGLGTLAEWRRVPAVSTLTIRGADHWRLYSSEGEPLTAGAGARTGLKAPRGSLLVLFGEAGDRAKVRR